MRAAALALPLALLVLAACQEKDNASKPPDWAARLCQSPRPQICTREYRPVCGYRLDGTVRTYGNPCDACADRQVERHAEGPCR